MSRLKKFLLLSLSISFLITSLISFKVFEQFQYSKAFPNVNNITVHLTETNNNVISNKFITDVQKAAEKSKVSLFKIIYEPYQQGKKPKIIYYVYNYQRNSFYKNVLLDWGRELQNNGDSGKFLSNQNTGDPNQVGQIEILYNENIIEVRPIEDLVTRMTDGNFILTTQDTEVALGLAKGLTEDYKYDCSVNSFGISAQLETNIYSYLWIAALLLCLNVLIVITYTYMVVLRYKEFGVARLFGSSNTNIINTLIQKECCPAILSAALISVMGTLIYFKWYNDLVGINQFLFLFCMVHAALIFVWILILFIFGQTIRALELNALALKGKKSPLIIKILNICVEIIFLVAAVTLCASAVDQAALIASQSSNMKKLEITKNYATIGFSYNLVDVIPMYETETKIENLHTILNKDGGVLFAASSYYRNKEDLPSSLNYKSFLKKSDYTPEKCMVSINNNYLKLNPIYDTQGNRVNLPDEDAIGLTVLVPEKYKSFEQEIKNLYTDYHTFFYYWLDDLYKKATEPEHINYDPLIPDELLAHHQPLPVALKFVKNQQDYYSYMPWVVPERHNTITDPIAVVVNNKNTGKFLKSEYLVNGFFWGKTDYYHPTASLQNAIKKADVGDEIVSISPLYDAVSQSIRETQGQIRVFSTMFIISIFAVIIITLFSCINYLNDNRQRLAIKRIHGYSFFAIYKFIFLSQFGVWCVANLLLAVLFRYLNIYISIPLQLFLPISIGALIIQIATTFLTIRMKGLSKINSTLKGA